MITISEKKFIRPKRNITGENALEKYWLIDHIDKMEHYCDQIENYNKKLIQDQEYIAQLVMNF